MPFEPEHLATFIPGDVERKAVGGVDLGGIGHENNVAAVSLREHSPDGARTLGIGALVEVDGALWSDPLKVVQVC